MKLCILGNKNWTRAKRLKEEAEERGHEVYLHDPGELLFSVDNSAIEVLNNIPWRELSAVVVFRSLPQNVIYGWVHFLSNETNVQIFFNHFEDMTLAHRSFLHRALVAEQAGIKTPKSIYFGPQADISGILDFLDFPMVVKRTHSSGKKAVELVRSPGMFRQAIDRVRKGEAMIYAREFIPHEVEWRVMILDQKPIAIYERRSESKEFLGAFAKDAIRSARNPEEVPDVVEVALKTADALEYELCGIDIIRHQESGVLYMLDANPMPAFSWTEKVSGIDVGEILIKYIEEQVG